MPLFYKDLIKDENKDKLKPLIAFAAAAKMSDSENESRPEESLLFDKDLFLTVAKKYDMDLEISGEEYKYLYNLIQIQIGMEENEEKLADILAEWVNDEKTQKIIEEIQTDYDLTIIRDMENFIEDLKDKVNAVEQASGEDREMEASQQEAQDMEILENYRNAKAYVDSLTTQEAVDGRVAQYLNNQSYLAQYWSIAKYELNRAENTSEHAKMKQRVTEFLGKSMIPVIVNEIMNNISNEHIEDILGRETGENDRERLKKEIEETVNGCFEEALEHAGGKEYPIQDNQEYDGLLKFIGDNSEAIKDPVAQRIESVKEENIWRQRERNAKEKLEELKHRLENKVEDVLQSPGSEDIRQYMRRAKYVEEEESRKLLENGATQERQAEFENFKAQLDQSSAELIMSRMQESIKSGISNIDFVGLSRSQDKAVIENSEKQQRSELEKYIYDKIVSIVQKWKMEIQPEKPSNFMASEQDAKKIENPQQAGVQNEEEKLQDVVVKNADLDVVNEAENPKPEEDLKPEDPKAQENSKPEEVPKPEGESGGFTMDELYEDGELDEMGDPIIPEDVPREEVRDEEKQVENEEVNHEEPQDNPKVNEEANHEEPQDNPEVNKEEVKVEEEEDLSLEDLFKEEEPKVQVNPAVQEEEPKVNKEEPKVEEPKVEEEEDLSLEDLFKEEEPKVQVNPEVQNEEVQEQEPVDLGQRMVDIDAVEMNRNLHALLEDLQEADPFYIRSSQEFKNMKELLTTMVRNLDRKGDFLDYEGLRELTTDMKRLQTLTDKYLTMKNKETEPSNNALRRMAVANRILNAADKYATPLSGILNGDRTVRDADKLREMLNQSRAKEAQAVDKMPEGLGKDIAQNALLARERLEQFACSKTALSESEQQEARGCFHLLISNRLVQMQSKRNVRMNLEEEVPMIINEVSQMKEFNVDDYTKDPKHIAEFLNNHMENKMIKEYISSLAQVQAQAKVRENDGQVREHDDSQLNQQERVNEKVNSF